MLRGNSLTVAMGTALTVLPQLLPLLPAKYRDLATAIIAALVQAYHLYAPSPSQQSREDNAKIEPRQAERRHMLGR